MKKLLIIIHEHLETKSRVNKKLIDVLKESNSVDTIIDIYKEYPDFKIDVAKEQKLLLEHDLIIMQNPIYWYTMPPLGHHYINKVFAFGFAYGGAYKLEGKKWLSVFTTGSPLSTYRSGGRNNFTLSEIARPFQQTALYCKMEWMPIFSVTGALNNGLGKPITDEELNLRAEEYKNLLASY